jgi:hypothetical protein
MSDPEYHYIAFIDEAGDPGLKAVIRDFWGVFSHLNEALRYDKSELGDYIAV